MCFVMEKEHRVELYMCTNLQHEHKIPKFSKEAKEIIIKLIEANIFNTKKILKELKKKQLNSLTYVQLTNFIQRYKCKKKVQ
jgi:hypothetical protein